MTVRYWKPLEDALQRTRALLFAPFDAVRWFVLGFTAWLIHLGSMGGSAAGNDPDLQAHVRTGDWEGAFDALGEAFGELLPSGLAAMLILGLIALGILISLVLLWVGSRARFVWLENLTRGDHRLGQHWSSQGHLGDSFFLWKVIFYAALLVVITPIVLFGGLIGALTGEGIGGPATVMGWVGLGIAVVLVAVVAGYVDFFAESFVTRIMHRRSVGVMAGWREFGRLFGERPGHFVLVGIAKLVLRLAGGALVLAVGLATCCVGFLLVSLPYIGAVLQLPIYVALRYYDLCWLGQLDPDLGPPDPARLTAGESTPDSDPSP
ncbi:hypothetical protein GF314_11655 [bacterium]|nr:hypothetical protein [bacterium]